MQLTVCPYCESTISWTGDAPLATSPPCLHLVCVFHGFADSSPYVVWRPQSLSGIEVANLDEPLRHCAFDDDPGRDGIYRCVDAEFYRGSYHRRQFRILCAADVCEFIRWLNDGCPPIQQNQSNAKPNLIPYGHTLRNARYIDTGKKPAENRPSS